MPSLDVKFTGDSKDLERTLKRVRGVARQTRVEFERTSPLNALYRSLAEGKGPEKVREVGSELRRFALSTAGVVGVGEAMRKTLESAKELVTASKRLGIGVEPLQVLRQAAKDSNVEFGALAGAIEKIDVARANALSGGSGAQNFLRSFQALGISLEDLKTKTASEIFTGPLATQIKKTDPEQIAGPLREVFGRGFGEFVPVLQTNFEELGETMKSTGAIMGSDTAAKLTALGNEFEIIGQIVTAKLAPALLALGEWAYRLSLSAGGKIAEVAAAAGSFAGQGSLFNGLTAALAAVVVSGGNFVRGRPFGLSKEDKESIFDKTGVSIDEVKSRMAEAEDPWLKNIDEFNKALANAAAALKTGKPDASFSGNPLPTPGEKNKAPKIPTYARAELTANQAIGAFAMPGQTTMISLVQETNSKIAVTNAKLDQTNAKLAEIAALTGKRGGIPGFD